MQSYQPEAWFTLWGQSAITCVGVNEAASVAGFAWLWLPDAYAGVGSVLANRPPLACAPEAAGASPTGFALYVNSSSGSVDFSLQVWGRWGGRSPHVCLSCVDVQRFAALLAVQLTWGACVGIRTTVTGRNQWHHVGFALVGGTVSDGAAMLFADGGTRDAYLRCVCERFTVVAHCRCKLCVLACALSKPSFVCICYHFIALAREPASATVEHYS